ncbi:ubiquitin-like protein [Neurospora tetrasperma FGSC 2509]|nr:ubiquitin-like protein [Neurospora tetrasperma FGSC 2509]
MADSDRPRSRSRSPSRKPKINTGGFKWKQKSSTSYDDNQDRAGLQRGYRDRSPRTNRDRDDDRNRDRDFGRDRDRSPRRRDDRDHRSPRRDRPDRPKKEKPAAASAPTSGGGGEEMIIVTVNDRLGTKAQIPAFPSDTIKQFKVMVAMRVGREPHEILLKRQGERPFKDQLSLADYGVSNGVQIDLEVDTGD